MNKKKLCLFLAGLVTLMIILGCEDDTKPSCNNNHACYYNSRGGGGGTCGDVKCAAEMALIDNQNGAAGAPSSASCNCR
jgi:hypothetical protein